MPLSIIHGDITKRTADAIVNAANTALLQGGGVCGAIFAAAGARELAAACAEIGSCAVGEAVATAGFRLPAKTIIHTVGPVWSGGTQGEEALLRACYRNSLALASSLSLRSVAFPLISSGIFGYPKGEAFSVAVSEIGAFLARREMEVELVLFPGKPVSERDARYAPLSEYLRSGGVQAGGAAARRIAAADSEAVFARPQEAKAAVADARTEAPAAAAPLAGERKSIRFDPTRLFPLSLRRALEQAEETFSQRLLRLIDERNLTDPVVYQRANLDRRLFSKLRGNPAYRPSKNTALALAVALRLNLDETADLLRRAGYALSPSSRFDRIVEYFIKKGVYDVYEINEALYAFDESQLGAGA